MTNLLSFSFSSFRLGHADHKKVFRKMQPVDDDEDVSVAFLMVAQIHNQKKQVGHIIAHSSALYSTFKRYKTKTRIKYVSSFLEMKFI